MAPTTEAAGGEAACGLMLAEEDARVEELWQGMSEDQLRDQVRRYEQALKKLARELTAKGCTIDTNLVDFAAGSGKATDSDHAPVEALVEL